MQGNCNKPSRPHQNLHDVPQAVDITNVGVDGCLSGKRPIASPQPNVKPGTVVHVATENASYSTCKMFVLHGSNVRRMPKSKGMPNKLKKTFRPYCSRRPTLEGVEHEQQPVIGEAVEQPAHGKQLSTSYVLNALHTAALI